MIGFIISLIHVCLLSFFLYRYGDHRDRHVLTHSFPTLRSADLPPRLLFWLKISGRAALSCAADDLDLAEAKHHCQSLCHGWLSMRGTRSEEHTSELQSLMRISYAVFCLNKKINTITRFYPPNAINQTLIHATDLYFIATH